MEDKLHNRLIADISEVNRLRASRLVYRDTGPPPLFLYIALVKKPLLPKPAKTES